MTDANETALEVLSRLCRESGGLASLQVLVADRCNHSCIHCYQVQGLKGELSSDDLMGVFRRFRDAGGLLLSISGGEATLRPDLLDLVEGASGLGLAIVLMTNAYLVTPEMARRLARCRIWRVDVSVYSDLADEHDAVTRVPGSWSRTIEGVRYLRDAGLRVALKTTLTAASSATQERMLAFARSLASEIHLAGDVAAGEGGTLRSTGARAEPERVAALSRLAGDEACAPPSRRAPCGAGAGGYCMRSDGIITPCTNLAIPVADAMSADYRAAILESEVGAFFRALTWDDLHGCRDCDLKPSCHRCHASALSEVGDLLAPYRGACEVAAAHHAEATGIHAVHDPDPACAPGRDRLQGPFRIQPDASLLPVPDTVTSDDDALAARFPWIRPSPEALAESAIGDRAPGGRRSAREKLVQLRIPKLDESEHTACSTTLEPWS